MFHLSGPSKIGQAFRPFLKVFGLWGPVMELARAYEYIMGLVIFLPLTILSWFPFVSEFQTRMFFNQAFSRGLQISMILSGRKEKIIWNFSASCKPILIKIICNHIFWSHSIRVFSSFFLAFGDCCNIPFMNCEMLLTKKFIVFFPSK